MHTHIQTNMRTNTQTHDMMDTYKHKPLSLSNMGGGKDRATVGRGDDTGGYKKRLKNETTLQLDRIGVLGKGGLPNSHISGASLQHFFNKNPRKSRGTYSE